MTHELGFFKIILVTIIPRTRVGYELLDIGQNRSTESAIIGSYPISVNGIIVLLNTDQTLDENIVNFIFYRLESSTILEEHFP